MVAALTPHPLIDRLAEPRIGGPAGEGIAVRVSNLFSVDAANIRHLPAAVNRKASSRELKVQARRVLHLIERFRFHCHQRSTSSQLADIVHAVIEGGKGGFDLVLELRSGKGRPCADERRCLDDLEHLLQLLREEHRPPAEELDHAMDSLIVECVRWDAAAGDEPELRSRP